MLLNEEDRRAILIKEEEEGLFDNLYYQKCYGARKLTKEFQAKTYDNRAEFKKKPIEGK